MYENPKSQYIPVHNTILGVGHDSTMVGENFEFCVSRIPSKTSNYQKSPSTFSSTLLEKGFSPVHFQVQSVHPRITGHPHSALVIIQRKGE